MKTLVRYFVVLSTLIVFSIGHAVEVDQGAVQELSLIHISEPTRPY